MKRLLLPMLLALSLGGCVTTTLDPNAPSVFSGGQSVTARIPNPVGAVDIYRIKAVYASANRVVVGYRQYCWERSYKALMADPVARPICQNRRANVRAAQAARAKAARAIIAADQFIRNNPTLSAISAVSAAWAAVTTFQNTVNSSAVQMVAAR